MLEEMSVADVLTIAVPTVVGVAIIGLLTLLAFWLGSGQQRSYEEAMARATKEAEQVISREREQHSPRQARKKRPKKKKPAEENETPVPPLKPILKNSSSKPQNAQPERSPQKLVEFQLDSPPRHEEERAPRTNPPTPHPSKQSWFDIETPKMEDLSTVTPTKPAPSKPAPTKPTPPPAQKPVPAAAQKPLSPPLASKVADTSGNQKKSRPKIKHQIPSLDSAEMLPASRILEIVGASPLSDDDIQQLIEQLLEKRNTNAEWQEASLRSESVHSLKKLNQEIQSRCEEAERTVIAHNNKIKELRSEIQHERARHLASDNSLQSKISQHLNELQVARTKISGLEEELKQAKSLSTSSAYQQLQKENTSLQTQMTTLAQQNSSLNTQLAALTKQLQEHQDSHTATKNELRRAKESLKNSTDTKPFQDKISELEAAVSSLEQVNTSLQSEIESLRQWGAPPQRDEEEEEEEKEKELEARHADNMQALQRELEGRHREEVDKMKEEHRQETAVCQSEHEAEVQRLRETLLVAEKEIEELRQKQLEERVPVEELASVEECVLVQEQAPQLMEQPLESVLNGPVENGGDVTVSLEEHKQLVREKEELTEQVKEMEKRLEELKVKNNTLRDNCWKARDDAATLEKTCDQKLKQAYREAEQRCKAAKAEALTEARDAQKSLLQQLLPDVSVGEEEDIPYTSWLDLFEDKAQEYLEHMKNKALSLQEEVERLRENEHGSIEEAQQLRLALEEMMGVMSRLQSGVDESNREHQHRVQEKDQMIERERSTNKALQEQLRQGKEEVSILQRKLEDVAGSQEDSEQRLQELEHHRSTAQSEAETLRHSLNQELGMKEQFQQQIEEVTERCTEMETQVKEEVDKKEELRKKNLEMMEEIQGLQQRLREAEKQLEELKNSNREPSVHIDTLDPKLAATSTDV